MSVASVGEDKCLDWLQELSEVRPAKLRPGLRVRHRKFDEERFATYDMKFPVASFIYLFTRVSGAS